ncbi:asparaginase [Thraustotheca clavata]|uniref:asparaginase n=1 Tax=Thraustotheca clavata TaxID=74557 RepID=A0A1V9ZQT6_9STRA|nr:asparaginase [Thraustotheca clavata]
MTETTTPMEEKAPERAPRHSIADSTCLILYTGGTFGMAPDANGVLHPKSGFLEKKVHEMDEFKFGGMPKVTILEWAEPIDSSDMTPNDWGRIASTIEEHYWDYDGFVVLQGTDTMAYTASALSFMLESLGKPVVVAGAMIPLHFPHSDARRNLIMSVICAATLDIPEVCIYSNDKLLRGNRTTKIANMSVDAFQSPNHPVLALTGVETTIEHGLILPYPRRRYDRALNIRDRRPCSFSTFTNLHTNICVFHLVPGFDDECINAYVDRHNREPNKSSNPKAMVFALYGTGNAPLKKDGFLSVVQRALNSEIAVVVTTQCLYGRTQLDTYATGVKLLEMGVITSYDMTIESCVTKLAYLMGKGYRGNSLKEKMETDLRGELSLVDHAGEDLSRNQSNNRKTVKKLLGH